MSDKAKTIIELVVIVLGVSLAPFALAGSSVDEATFTVVDEGAAPNDVVKLMELPDHASATAAARSRPGLTTANNSKDHSDETHENAGQQVSVDAHTANIFDQARADAAQQARRDKGARH